MSSEPGPRQQQVLLEELLCVSTHCAVGVWRPDGEREWALQKEVLGNDQEASQCTEEADGVCDQVGGL